MNDLAILIPVYNDQDGLARTFRSLAADDYPAHIFVVDDGSAVPITLPEAGPSQQAFLLRMERNVGITRALNEGIHWAGDGYRYLARLDAGDLVVPGRFGAQELFLDNHPDHAVVGSWAIHTDINKRTLFQLNPPTEHEPLMRFMRRRNGIIHPSAMIRMAHLHAVGLYDPAFCGAEDWDLWFRLGKRYKLANLPTAFLVKEMTPHQITARPGRHLHGLRVQLRHFDWSADAALGIARTIVAIMAMPVPRRPISVARGWFDRYAARPS